MSRDRDYEFINKEIAMTGFFSEYLPPCFALDERVLLSPPPANCDLIKPLSFTMSRFNANDARRTIFIPEVGSYIAAHMFMSENGIYESLIRFTETETFSFSPILGKDSSIMRHEQSYGGGDRSLTSIYIDNVSEKLTRAAGAKKVLKLDISNCFSSFYMHMIPAIMLGADMAEVEYNKSLKKQRDASVDLDSQYVLFAKLDEIIRRQNLNRTNGLLPGILSSKMIAEALLTRIDKELAEKQINFVRYVDDYEVFLYENNEDAVISIFTKILRKYGFSLNFEKQQIIEFPFYMIDNFEKILGNRLKKIIDHAELIDIFNSFFSMEKNGTKGAIRYLLKTCEKFNLRVDDPELYKSYLLTIMANNPRSLSKVCAILINNKEKYSITQIDKKIIVDMLTRHIDNGNDLEAMWLLYLLIETANIAKDDWIINKIVNQSSELSTVLLLRKELLNEENLNTVKQKADSWILLYELYQKDHIVEATFVQRMNLDLNLPMYQKFKRKGIHFVY